MDRLGVGQLSLSLPKGKSLRSLEPSESQIEMAICHYLRVKGYFFWKQPNRGYFSGKVSVHSGRKVMVGSFRKDMNPYTRQGIPDIIIVSQGRFIGLEVKTRTNHQSEAQKEFEGDLQSNGGKYFVVRSIEDVENALREI